MDAAYFEELAGRLYGLLISLDDRIGPEQARLLHHFIEADEYGLALEEIAGMLALAARINLEEGLVHAHWQNAWTQATASAARCDR